MQKHNIWLLLDSSKSGGIESHVQQLSEGLTSHGEQVEVVFMTDYGHHPLRDRLDTLGIRHTSLDGTFSTLYKTIKQQQPMVVHTHGYKAGILGRFAARLNRIACISTYHAGEIATGKLGFYDWLDRFTACLSNKNFAVSPQIATRLPGQVALFDNFVNTDHLSDATGEQIAFVGRVSEEKGPDYFKALASLLPNLDFHLYGEGPQLPELQKQCPKNLILHGQQDDMSLVWSNIGLLVLPSRFEGLPMAALEAMARGIPVLAFNVGALNKLIDHGFNGWLIEPGNMDLLTKQVSAWSTFSEQHKQCLQSACKSTIKKQFSSCVAIPKLIADYQQVVK
ncbi:glycosyl transferase [Psychromonas marina]|uniref:Glycosyl transferase n=1 Tax=Psychromonas marina TaxID=88364 RepID=A0ABQ6E1P4_9GAMM|nr:glycosyltransferase family 4 protein [Psychromonas marina]GLS91281.1 glycosyl transferase [Psychromonas marina]